LPHGFVAPFHPSSVIEIAYTKTPTRGAANHRQLLVDRQNPVAAQKAIQSFGGASIIRNGYGKKLDLHTRVRIFGLLMHYLMATPKSQSTAHLTQDREKHGSKKDSA
jgi:hypothetical protein